MSDAPGAPRFVNAIAPIRICDNGGWTDTWFAGHGKVFNIGVSPYVEVKLSVHRSDGEPNRVAFDVVNDGDRYEFDPRSGPGRHPLLEAAVDLVGVPDAFSIEIAISSNAPAGGSTATSAAVAVALIGALDALTPGRMSLHEIAYAAHRVEVERLGVQSGVQDQLCAAYGGINFIEVPSYPDATVSQIGVPEAVWSELDRRLVLVYLGRAHVSSEVHDRVIARLDGRGAQSRELDALRAAAEAARDAVCAADFAALGRAMTANTEAQRQLHADLVSGEAQAVFDVAREFGAPGWKVNGAGGEGGSVTILCGQEPDRKRELLRAVAEAVPQTRIIPTALSRHGVRVWQTEPSDPRT